MFWYTLSCFDTHYHVLIHTIMFWYTLPCFDTHYHVLIHTTMFWYTLPCFDTHYHVLIHTIMFSNGIVNRKLTACSVTTLPNLYLIHCLKLHSIQRWIRWWTFINFSCVCKRNAKLSYFQNGRPKNYENSSPFLSRIGRFYVRSNSCSEIHTNNPNMYLCTL